MSRARDQVIFSLADQVHLVGSLECRVVIASSRGESIRASPPIDRARTGRFASDGSSSFVVASETLRKLHKTLDPCRRRVKSSPGTPTLAVPEPPVAYQ